MTVHQQIVDVCSTTPDVLLTASEIKRRVIERFGTNPNSIIPSDYCYNRWNRGIKLRNPLFVRVGTSEYRYVGPDQPYTGLVFCRAKGSDADQVCGEWVNGKLTIYEVASDPINDAPPSPEPNNPQASRPTSHSEGIPLSAKQLDRLYEEYMEVLTLEVSNFGCKPTETRHLIGRLGEFYCARLTHGRLAHRVNQEGFDVVAATGKRVSVKTTAQVKGFVSMNANTLESTDELMVLQYNAGDFEVVYYGDVAPAVEAARLWKGRFELDLTKARKLTSGRQQATLQNFMSNP